MSSIAPSPDFRLLLLLLLFLLFLLPFIPTFLWSSPEISTLFLRPSFLTLASFDTCTIPLGIEPSVIGPLRLWIALREQFYIPGIGGGSGESENLLGAGGGEGQTNLFNF